jgi:hypothetical protein
MFFSYGNEAIVINHDAPILLAAGSDGPLSRLHHNTLKHCLTADLAEATADAAILFLAHLYIPLSNNSSKNFKIIY